MNREKITTKDGFKEFSSAFQAQHDMPFAFGIGIPFKDLKGETIAVKWLSINVNENLGTAAALMEAMDIVADYNENFLYQECDKEEVKNILETYFSPFIGDNQYHSNVVALQRTIEAWIDEYDLEVCCVGFYQTENVLLEKPVACIGDAHFRLALISRLKYKPNTLSLENMFSVLPNLIWNNGIPITVEDWNTNEWLEITRDSPMADKIPLLTWGAPVPEGVRIANPQMVRLGAYLSPGTTVMHYGFVNFNAGTLGKAMVEGRISAGTVIGDGTDIGAGAGFNGTLSGGGSVKLSAGAGCLLGAQSQCGIVLGDNCAVATGTHFTQEVHFAEYDKDEKTGKYTKLIRKGVKAKEFSGVPNLLFLRHDETGEMQVWRRGNKVMLNEALHSKQ